MVSIIKYNAKKRTYTGTNENDVLDASILNYEPIGKTNIKKNLGLIITGGNGDDKITGTDYNDTIKGGNGNDRITGGLGVDNITGGAGITTINYSKGDGNDIINLTKGENFTLNFTDLTIDDLRFEFTNKNKDLRIYTSQTSDDEFITIKNFVKKDVTNNSNTKKSIVDTSSVELVVGGETYDLRTSKKLTDNKDVVLYKTTLGENAKNYTGTWLNDEINASEVKLYKKVKEGKKKVTVEKDVIDTGLTIKGGAGNDIITGSKYSDKIYGNIGTDTINAGTGNNYLYFNKGDGNDIIENGGGVDTLVFAKKTNLTYSYDKYDLIIKYSYNDTVTLKDYLKGHSVQYVQIGKTKTILNPPRPQINEYNEDGYNVIEGTVIADTIVGTNNNDKIFGNEDDDNINGKKGSDILDGGVGINTYSFTSGDGNDVIVNGAGTDTIEFDREYVLSYSRYLNGNDLIINYRDNDSVTLQDYFVNNSHSTSTILNGTKELNISEEVEKGYSVIGTNSAETFDGTVNVPFTYVVNGGTDLIQNSKNTDTIKLDTQETISYSKASNSNDLVITYGNNKVTVKDYFNTDNHVQRIVNRTTTLNIAEEIENKLEVVIPENETNISGTTNNDIIHLKDSGISLIVSEGDGNDIVYSGISEDTLVISDKTFDDISYKKVNNDLVIGYSANDSVTLKNYFTEEHSVKNITAGDVTDLLVNRIDDLTINITQSFVDFIGTNYNDTIINNAKYGYNIYGQKGNDNITNETNGSVQKIYGDEGNDIITNNGITRGSGCLYGGDGDDTIINNGSVNGNNEYGEGYIRGNDGDDTIVNNGIVFQIEGGRGHDTITNRNNVTWSIYGDEGNESWKSGDDTIINYGTVAGFIEGNRGSDTIINYGIVDGGISGDKGNDIIITEVDSYSNYIFFCSDDGNDILYLNATNNNLNFSSDTGSRKYYWYYEDLVIKYNNKSKYPDSVTIKNYNPLDTYVNVKIGVEDEKYIDLSTLVPEKIITNAEGKTTYNINGDEGTNTIINNGTVLEDIVGDAGNDTITNNGTALNIYGGEGDDAITNEIKGTVSKYIYGDTGNDTITNNGTALNIYGGEGDDAITNEIKGTVSQVYGGPGDDTIINNGTMINSYWGNCLSGDGGNDVIINSATGTVEFMNGGSGNDTIINNGIVLKGIERSDCGGDDTVITGANSSVPYIYVGYGHDTLYLNATINNLYCYRTGDKTYTWNGDDLVIKFNNSEENSVTIKNYNPLNTDVTVKIGASEDTSSYTDLAILVPERPNTLSVLLGASNTNINELSAEVVAFTCANDSDVAVSYTTPDTNDLTVVMSEYTNTDLQSSL